VVLQAGAIIPADLRLISAKDFFVSQSSLTGESMPVEKTPTLRRRATGRGSHRAAERLLPGQQRAERHRARRGGEHRDPHHFGSISEKLSGQRVQTSFDRGIAGFTWLMIRFMVVMVSVVFLIVGITKHDWLEALLFASRSPSA
jgi:Mg2+-importing ATPase